MTASNRTWPRLTAALLGMAALASCAVGTAPSGTMGNPAAVAAGFPVAVGDCRATTVTLNAPPRHIVTSDAAALELLFWLGVGDRVIGTGFPPGVGELPAQFQVAGGGVPVLDRGVIPQEKLLGSGADLYVDAFASAGNTGAGGSPTDEEFAAAGISHLHLMSTACPPSGSGPLVDLSTVENDITRLGMATGTTARAATLVASMQAKLGRVRQALASVPQDQRPTYFFFDYDAGTSTPMVVCDKQVANAVITLAGARNIFGDCAGDRKAASWEAVVARNPAWIQLGVRNRGSAEANQAAFAAAEEFLRDFPATAGLDAVKRGRFLRIGSEQTTIAGVRDADTVVAIASALYPGLVNGDG